MTKQSPRSISLSKLPPPFFVRRNPTKSALFKRGWNQKLIDDFLGDPSYQVSNPYYGRAPSMCVYRLELVEAIEGTAAFQEAKQQSEARRAAKMPRIPTWLAALPMEVPLLSWDELAARACEFWNDQQQYRPDQQVSPMATPASERDFLERIAVYYLRHDMDRYHSYLGNAPWNLPVPKGQVLIKQRILLEIARGYPQFADECRRLLWKPHENFYELPLP